MDVAELLKQVQQGTLSIENATYQLKNLPYEDLGFAKLDHHRKIRQGFEEVIFCPGKSIEHLQKIYLTLENQGINVLGTKASPEQSLAVQELLPNATYDPLSRILKVEHTKKELIGKIVVCTGGTADIPIAEEAASVAEFLGSNVERLFDVGVAGIHRLLSNLSIFDNANCIIAVAGMEGALPGVIAGLVDVPVIAVPTSIGYGTNFKGVSALLTMLNSCANGITVVNIDNGYGAGYVATQINQLVTSCSI